MQYVIGGTQYDERLWWSDQWGWTGSIEKAEVYSTKDPLILVIPSKGAKDVSFEDLPDIVCPECNPGTNAQESTTIADHGHCSDCQAEWRLEDHDLHGELD